MNSRHFFDMGLALASIFTLGSGIAGTSTNQQQGTSPTWYTSGAATFGNAAVDDTTGAVTKVIQPVTISGSATSPPSRIADSVSPLNEAISAIRVPSCPAGQVMSGSSCIYLPTAPTACASGTILSGGVCVPMPSYTTSCGTAIASTQSIPCPSGQTGQIDQSRTVTCNASTSYAWVPGSWTTASSSCVTPRANCGASVETVGYCSYNVSATPDGSSTSADNTVGGYTGKINGTCSNGSWTNVAASCVPKLIPPQQPAQPTGLTGSNYFVVTSSNFNGAANSIDVTFIVNPAGQCHFGGCNSTYYPITVNFQKNIAKSGVTANSALGYSGAWHLPLDYSFDGTNLTIGFSNASDDTISINGGGATYGYCSWVPNCAYNYESNSNVCIGVVASCSVKTGAYKIF